MHQMLNIEVHHNRLHLKMLKINFNIKVTCDILTNICFCFVFVLCVFSLNNRDYLKYVVVVVKLLLIMIKQM